MRRKNRDSPVEASAFTEQLKTKGRKRRDGQARIQAANMMSNPARNDLTPPLTMLDLPLDALRLPARKVRAIDEAHVQEIARAIAGLGFCAPILIGKDNLVLDGQSRVEAARRLGLTHVPCIRVEHLGEKEQRLLRLAVNRIGEKGRWNLEELKLEFEELILEDAPIEISGFTVDEIDQIALGDEASALETGPLAPAAGATAVARVGDTFQFGRHKLAFDGAPREGPKP